MLLKSAWARRQKLSVALEDAGARSRVGNSRDLRVKTSAPKCVWRIEVLITMEKINSSREIVTADFASDKPPAAHRHTSSLVSSAFVRQPLPRCPLGPQRGSRQNLSMFPSQHLSSSRILSAGSAAAAAIIFHVQSRRQQQRQLTKKSKLVHVCARVRLPTSSRPVTDVTPVLIGHACLV